MTAPTPWQFGIGSNVSVRMYCTESSRRESVRDHISSVARRACLFAGVPSHEAIPTNTPMHYILWNAPIPEEIPSTFLSSFRSCPSVRHTTSSGSSSSSSSSSVDKKSLGHRGFEDGTLRVIHVGGRGSINAKPEKHFERILRHLSRPSQNKNKNITLLTKDITRALRLTRDVANVMSTRVRSAIYMAFVRFMAQRPEFPGDPNLLVCDVGDV